MKDRYSAMIVNWGAIVAPPIVGIADHAHCTTDGTEFHPRPNYTLDQACQVANWLNGKDGPLHAMKDREHDEWDPMYGDHARRMLAADMINSPRKGLVPIRDKE